MHAYVLHRLILKSDLSMPSFYPDSISYLCPSAKEAYYYHMEIYQYLIRITIPSANPPGGSLKHSQQELSVTAQRMQSNLCRKKPVICERDTVMSSSASASQGRARIR